MRYAPRAIARVTAKFPSERQSHAHFNNLFHTAVNLNQTVFLTIFLHLYERPRVPEGYDYKTAFRRRHSDVFEEDVLRDIILGKSAI